jgi:hypothetical protein
VFLQQRKIQNEWPKITITWGRRTTRQQHLHISSRGSSCSIHSRCPRRRADPSAGPSPRRGRNPRLLCKGNPKLSINTQKNVSGEPKKTKKIFWPSVTRRDVLCTYCLFRDWFSNTRHNNDNIIELCFRNECFLPMRLGFVTSIFFHNVRFW